MAFPTTSILYPGTGANQNPATGFTDSVDGGTYGNIQRLSNVIRTVTTDAYPYWNATDFGADQEVYVTGLQIPTTGTFDLLMRLASVGTAGVDGYVASMRSDQVLRIYRLDNGVYTKLGADISSAWVDGEGFGAAVVGNTIEAFRESGGTWTSMGTRTDSTYTAGGKTGLYVELSDMTFTGFGGGTVVVASAGSRSDSTLLGIS